MTSSHHRLCVLSSHDKKALTSCRCALCFAWCVIPMSHFCLRSWTHWRCRQLLWRHCSKPVRLYRSPLLCLMNWIFWQWFQSLFCLLFVPSRKKWFQSLFALTCVSSRKKWFESLFQAEESDLNHFLFLLSGPRRKSDFNHFFALCAIPKKWFQSLFCSLLHPEKVISITFLFLAVPLSPPRLPFKLETWNLKFRSLFSMTFLDDNFWSRFSITFFHHFFRTLFFDYFFGSLLWITLCNPLFHSLFAITFLVHFFGSLLSITLDFNGHFCSVVNHFFRFICLHCCKVCNHCCTSV